MQKAKVMVTQQFSSETTPRRFLYQTPREIQSSMCDQLMALHNSYQWQDSPYVGTAQLQLATCVRECFCSGHESGI